jgi:hypothetical protein
MHADDAQTRPEGSAGDGDAPRGGLWPPEEWPPRSNDIRPFQGSPTGRSQGPGFPDTWWRDEDDTQAIPLIPAGLPKQQTQEPPLPPAAEAAADEAAAPHADSEATAGNDEAAAASDEAAAAPDEAGTGQSPTEAAQEPAPPAPAPLPAAIPLSAFRALSADTWANDVTPPYGIPAVESAPWAPPAAAALPPLGSGGPQEPHEGAAHPEDAAHHEDAPAHRAWWRRPVVLLPVAGVLGAVLVAGAIVAGRSLSGSDTAAGRGAVSVLHGSGAGAASAAPSTEPAAGTANAPGPDGATGTAVGPGGALQTVSPAAGGRADNHGGTSKGSPLGGLPGAPVGAPGGGPATGPTSAPPCAPSEIRQTLDTAETRPYGASVSWTWRIKNLSNHVCTIAPDPGTFAVSNGSGTVWRQSGSSPYGLPYGKPRFVKDPLPPRPFAPGESVSGTGQWSQEQDGTSSSPQPTQVAPGLYTLEAPGVSGSLSVTFLIEPPASPTDGPTPASATPTASASPTS